MSPGIFDLLLTLVVVVAYPVWDYFVGWPAMRARLESGTPDSRVRAYGTIALQEWGATAIVAALWLAHRRAWAALGLGIPGGWRLAVATVTVALMVALLVLQLRAVGRLTPDRRRRLAAKLAPEVSLVLPRTPEERGGFAALSVTAGICEEVVYRGFLVWALSPWLGAWGAAAVSLVGFTFAHAYQGTGFVLRTGLTGLVITLLALGTGSILPCIVVHALIDLLGGETGYAILGGSEPVKAPA